MSDRLGTRRGAGLWAELRRRNVIRMAGLYLVGAWLIVQIAETLLPAFDVPGWVLRATIILLAIGFVPALIFSWVFELTPDGLRREHEVDRATSVVDHTARKLDIAVIVLLIGVAAMLAWSQFGRAPSTTLQTDVASNDTAAESAPPARSIAVLAFADLSADGDQAYFADGIAEELLNLLARVDGFKVAARTSSFKFKGQQADIVEIGRALNVETVLEGSVRKDGNQVRVTAQLINVSDGFHIWSNSYDRELDSIFTMQDEIATAIVQALKLTLDIDSATVGRTENAAAYDHYLRGRQLAREPISSELLRAIEQFQQAIAIDPEFAAAYAGIAAAWVWLEDYGGVKSTEAFPLAEQAARRALEIDPNSAEALAAMAFVLDRYHTREVEAGHYFKRAIAANPSYVLAYNLYGDVLYDLGDYEEMLAVHRRAVELDPLSAYIKSRLASKLIEVGEFDEAHDILTGVLAEAPDSDFAREELGNLYAVQNRQAEALEQYRKLHAGRPGDPFAAANIAAIAIDWEDLDLADPWIAAARERGPDNRWELFAREQRAISRGDWKALERIADLTTGLPSASLRGVAASNRQQWSEARRHLLDALRMRGWSGSESVRIAHVIWLIELAWVERQLDLDEWRQRLAITRPVLEQAVADRINSIGNGEAAAFYLARVEAIEGHRAEALAALRGAREIGFDSPWFLAVDPVFAQWREDPEFRELVQDIRDHAAAERLKLAGKDILP